MTITKSHTRPTTFVTLPFINNVINEIEERYGDAPATIVKGFSLIPSILMNSKNTNWQKNVSNFAKVYKNDLVSFETLSPELLMWETYWSKEFLGDLPTTIAETLKAIHPIKKSSPNIYAALRLLATIPVTSCECEHAILVLRRLKTYLRSTMSEERFCQNASKKDGVREHPQ